MWGAGAWWAQGSDDENLKFSVGMQEMDAEAKRDGRTWLDRVPRRVARTVARLFHPHQSGR